MNCPVSNLTLGSGCGPFGTELGGGEWFLLFLGVLFLYACTRALQHRDQLRREAEAEQAERDLGRRPPL